MTTRAVLRSGDVSPAAAPRGIRPEKKGRQTTRILIVDDHPIFRDGLRTLLEMEPDFRVVGEAADGAEAVGLSRQLNPDVLLLDLALPRVTGLEVLRLLAASGLPVRAIVLAAAVDKSATIKALQLGARGVVSKESATALLFKSIRSVMAGEYWVGHQTVANLVQTLIGFQAQANGPTSATPFSLTRRELQIISLVVAGHANKEIAQEFSLSEDTVKHHLTNIFDKTGASNRLELALFAIHHRLVEVE